MALYFDCDRCGKEINEPGALLFSPPKNDRPLKKHICIKCWEDLLIWLNTR